jgi:tetratricopeptide (TPR) repeat protein
MRFKPFFLIVATALVLAASSVIATAQMTQISGKVTLKQSDGAEAPVVGAQIDIYRTDIKWEAHIKTDKKGAYQHAGIPFVGTYTIVVSAPGARPSFLSDIRFSARPVNDFPLDPGDGSRPTLDQLKALGAGAAGGNKGGGTTAPAESKESKAAREKLESESKEIEESNKKITSSNETINRTFKAGNDAFSAKNYDAAIAAYNEGIAAREEPALFANKSIALRTRGAERFNSVVTSTDQAAKSAGLEAANKDWVEAAAAGKKALDMMNAMTVPTEATEKANYDKNKLAAHASYAEAMRLVGTKVDKSQAEEAFKIYSEYAALDDPAKKSQRMADAVKILFDANLFDRASEEYKKLLANDPENVDANLYLGFSLFNTADKAKFQEAANYLNKFTEKAADTNPLKADARSILDFLKTQENIKPEKLAPTRTNTGGRRRP